MIGVLYLIFIVNSEFEINQFIYKDRFHIFKKNFLVPIRNFLNQSH